MKLFFTCPEILINIIFVMWYKNEMCNSRANFFENQRKVVRYSVETMLVICKSR